ncbi:MAG: hypothetical protein ABIR17_09605 [Pseudolysinimonas sp.]|uniref:hypothetical protein n=1 Tax=Pseudolysinimonas sp. TaxID=2680009 RepID=UPI00326711D5
MHRRELARGIAAIGAVGLGTGGLVVGFAAPALAFTGTCPTTVPAATLVADGVCEVRITADGTFTPPPGITKLSAVLIAAGGGGNHDVTFGGLYAGNGGEVVYIDSVTLGADLVVVVGLGGVGGDGSATGGDDTSLDATIAHGGGWGGSANPCSGADWNLYFGDGSQTLAQESPDCVPGVGYALSEIPTADATLFPPAADGTDVYGNGGNAAEVTGVPGANPVAGTGGDVSADGAGNGSAGLVILRFAPAPPATGPSLAATGSELALPAATLGATALAAGILLMVLRRRRTTHD